MRRTEKATLRWITRLLLKLIRGGSVGHHHHIHEPEPTFSLTFGPVSPKKVSTMADLNVKINNTQKILVTVSPYVEIEGGERGQIDGDVVATVTEGDATILETDPQDPFKFWIVSGSAIANSRVHMAADADLTSGTREITRDIVVEVTGVEANVLGAEFGTPEPK